MPKLSKLLETVKLFLFETYNEISGNSDCCPKKITYTFLSICLSKNQLPLKDFLNKSQHHGHDFLFFFKKIQ